MVYNFEYSKQLFLLMHVKYDVSNIPPFYQSLMNTWSLFSHQKVTPPSPVYAFEPLWYNSYVTYNSKIITDTVIQQFISLGIIQVKHLCEMKSYEPQFRSKRIFESLKRKITATSLPQHWNVVTCSRLSGLFQLTQSLIRKLTPTIDKQFVWWYIIGIPASAGLDVNVAQANIAIVYSRFNKNRSSGTQCVVTLLKS